MVESKRKSKDIPEKSIEDNQKSDSSIATNTPKKSVKPKTNSNKQDKPKPSPQQRCEEALLISKSEKWIQKSYQRLVDLVVDLSSKYSLTDIQYKF